MDAGTSLVHSVNSDLTDFFRPCKNRKIKCGEERPQCQNCERQGETCDYSIRLNWEGRTKRSGSNENHLSGKASSPPLKLERSISDISQHTIREFSPNPGDFASQRYSSPNPNTAFQPQPQNKDYLTTSQFSRIRDQAGGPYPSPADSGIDSPPPNTLNVVNVPYGGPQNPLFSQDMPPPIPNYNVGQSLPGAAFAEHRSKKMRFSPPVDRLDLYQRQQGQINNFVPQTNLNYMGSMISPPLQGYQSSDPSNVNNLNLPTPAASIGSEDTNHSFPNPSPQAPPQESPDFWRLSVKSLLSDDSPAESTSGSENVFPGKLNINSHFTSQKTSYGTDRGFPDLDLPRNQDATALNGLTPTLGPASFDNSEFESHNDLFSGFAFGVNPLDGFQEGAGYYARPVTVSISKSLEPLPPMLKDNPMNLLYFHHFLNHTARILVPHDCSENPFKSILPQSEPTSPVPRLFEDC